ncbi:stage III sporulation protein AF [Tuberibacillus sp. Marseille-P3662]|uniref:stage III sporulation protein AF n=1 Tax=Tuberibacillus sp. Marseille-P3662 TaxID=1965358 RepID=UPI001593642C|nr:stage III sporulation protein AF [Tuberibacillus sp. Marseille-P3662]
MDVLYQWITEIVLLILLAIVLELLLPNNAFQKYVKMVVSLIIVLALLSPIMKLFEIQPSEIIDEMAKTKETSEIQESIKMKKRVIESEQAEYTQNQTAVQMKQYVQEELIQDYGLAITNIDLQISEKKQQNGQQPVEHATVYVKEADTREQSDQMNAVDPVDHIQVSTKKETSSKDGQASDKQDRQSKEEASRFIAKKWEMDADQVTVYMEGGESADDTG